MRPVWLRSFTTERDSSFFYEDVPAVRRDLQAVRDILDESKESTLSIEPVTNTTPPSEHDWIARVAARPSIWTAISDWIADVPPSQRICWTAAVILLIWFGWAVMHAAQTAPS